MQLYFFRIYILVITFCSFSSFGQLSSTEVDENTAANIVAGAGVTIISATHSGGSNQLGSFSGGGVIGIESGIVLCTGNVTLADDGNSGTQSYAASNGSGLSGILAAEHGPNQVDVSELSITFIASATEVQFDMVFASEEYYEFVDTSFNDKMGVYMQGPGLATTYAGYENVAIIPGTNDFVSINNVNLNDNPSWYVNNPPQQVSGNPAPYPIEYDGFTKKMTIVVDSLTCGATYRIVFVIADETDPYYDSAIFIGANSIKSDFTVGQIQITASPPFCEGENIPVQITANSSWDYAWNGNPPLQGLSSTTIPAVFGDTLISVLVSDDNGCVAERFAPIEVHSSTNIPPSFVNMPEKLYVSMGDTICYEFHSTDSPNENVTMSYATIFPNPNVYDFSFPIFPGDLVTIHDKGVYCGSWMNFWDYGEYAISLKLEDNNACNDTTVFDSFIVDVLCPSCPECLVIDHREADYNPFFDGVVDAAKCLKIGTNVLPAGHGVDAEDYIIDFKAGESIEFGPGWKGGTNWSAQITGTSCSDQCNDCCTFDSELSFDPPQEPYILSPNNDGFNDVFFISDLANPYNAYRATYWELHIWPYSLIGWYPLGQKIWYYSNLGNNTQLVHPIAPICAGYETPTQQHPYKTFWWDGTFGIGGSVLIQGDLYNANVGDPVPPGLYRYTVDIDGCQIYPDDPVSDTRGHNLDLEGTIFVLPSSMAPVPGTDPQQNEAGQTIINLNSFSVNGEPQMAVYPNPTTNEVFISLSGMGEETSVIEVLSLTGQTLMLFETRNFVTPLELIDFERGIYLIRVTNGKTEFIEKVVLQ